MLPRHALARKGAWREPSAHEQHAVMHAQLRAAQPERAVAWRERAFRAKEYPTLSNCFTDQLKAKRHRQQPYSCAGVGASAKQITRALILHHTMWATLLHQA